LSQPANSIGLPYTELENIKYYSNIYFEIKGPQGAYNLIQWLKWLSIKKTDKYKNIIKNDKWPFVVAWKLDLQLPVLLVPNSTEVVNLNPAHGEVY